MKQQPFSFVLCAALGLLALATVSAEQTRPNILFIVADDLGYGEPGCYGGKEIPTPNIDALAASGTRFTSGYVTAPFCAASRAALLTGRYQTRFGFEFNPIGAKNALRHNEWKLIRDGGAWQLFDLTKDVSETADLAAKEPARVAELSALWDKWNAEQIEPLWK